jgi:hypothetical protein
MARHGQARCGHVGARAVTWRALRLVRPCCCRAAAGAPLLWRALNEREARGNPAARQCWPRGGTKWYPRPARTSGSLGFVFSVTWWLPLLPAAAPGLRWVALCGSACGAAPMRSGGGEPRPPGQLLQAAAAAPWRTGSPVGAAVALPPAQREHASSHRRAVICAEQAREDPAHCGPLCCSSRGPVSAAAAGRPLNWSLKRQKVINELVRWDLSPFDSPRRRAGDRPVTARRRGHRSAPPVANLGA